MSEDISVQILSQTSDNIQKLFDLSTRIDERVKSIQNKQKEMDYQMSEINKSYGEIMKQVAVLESKDAGSDASANFASIQKSMVELDKRFLVIESSTVKSNDRWNKIFTFVIQLVWVILAAYLLMKLNLQAPDVP